MHLFEPSESARFDPITFGMWLNIDAALKHKDYPQFGPLMWNTFHFPIGADHRQYVQSQRTQAEQVFAATCFTLATHERKHFHDLLATPYGSVLARQYTRAAFFFGMLQDEILYRRKNVAVPLSEWCGNVGLFESLYGVEPPSAQISDVTSIFDTMLEKLKWYDVGSINQERSPQIPSATSILEGLAIMVQLREIGEEFGLQYGNGFGRSILQSKAASRYFGALGIIPKMLGVQLPIMYDAYLLLGSLYGNFQDPTPDRVKYPTDLLLSLLQWLVENRVFAKSSLIDFEDLVAAVDKYFDERQGGSLQTMVQTATETNRKVLAALGDDLREYRAATGRDNPFCQCVLDVFANFVDVHESFAKRVCDNPFWYVSYDYIRERNSCPEPVTFIESEIGVPVTPEISRVYYIQNEDRMYLRPDVRDELLARSDIPELFRQNLRSEQTVAEFRKEVERDLADITAVAPTYMDDVMRADLDSIVIRNAYVLSPRSTFADTPSEHGPRTNLALWQRNNDNLGTLRLFLEGPDQGMTERAVLVALSALSGFHTDVYTAGGKLTAIAPDPNEQPQIVKEALSVLREIKDRKDA